MPIVQCNVRRVTRVDMVSVGRSGDMLRILTPDPVHHMVVCGVTKHLAGQYSQEIVDCVKVGRRAAQQWCQRGQLSDEDTSAMDTCVASTLYSLLRIERICFTSKRIQNVVKTSNRLRNSNDSDDEDDSG